MRAESAALRYASRASPSRSSSSYARPRCWRTWRFKGSARAARRGRFRLLWRCPFDVLDSPVEPGGSQQDPDRGRAQQDGQEPCGNSGRRDEAGAAGRGLAPASSPKLIHRNAAEDGRKKTKLAPMETAPARTLRASAVLGGLRNADRSEETTTSRKRPNPTIPVSQAISSQSLCAWLTLSPAPRLR